MSRRILITGATGGLGKALVREALERGHHVRASGRDTSAGKVLEAMGARFVPCDLCASQANLRQLTDGCQSVIHAAALSASWGERSDFERSNVKATRMLLDCADAADVTRFVFISSPSIYAALRDRIGIGSNDAPSRPPLNHYARTKLEAERLVLAHNRDGMATCAIRPRALVGKEDRVILPRLVEMASRRRLPLPGGGNALIEMTDLRDAAWAICEAEERAPEIAGKAINISGGKPTPVKQVADALAAVLGKSPQLVSLPLPVARALATVLERTAQLAGMKDEPPLTRYTLATLAYSQTFDLEPARRLLGYSPRYDALATVLDGARKLAERA